MNKPLQVKVSRDGKDVGTYEATEAIRLLVYGTLKETDFYWHDGMTDWAPLVKLQTSEDRRKLLKQMQDENLAVAEAVRARMEKRKENFFTCSCCKDTFENPIDPRGLFWKGFGVILLSGIVFTMGMILSIGALDNSVFSVMALGLIVLSVLSSLSGFSLILSSALRSPFCPSCHSTNYSRPGKGERPVFD